MIRTAEQQAADDNLTAAIEQVIKAYAMDQDESSWVMSDYVIITAQSAIGDDGDEWVANDLICRAGSVPPYRVLGLLSHALLQVKSDINAD